MKKLISLAMALVMAATLCVPAFAEEPNGGTGNYTADVTGSFVEGWEEGGIIYSVDIQWDGLAFTYHEKRGPVWDPEKLSYSETSPAYWEGEGTITITSKSNAVVKATPSFRAADTYSDTSMSFSHNVLRLASAADTNTAQVATITVTPSGSLAQCDDNSVIGTITLSIAGNDLDFSSVEKVDTAYNDDAVSLVLFNQDWTDNTVASAEEVASGEQYVLTSEWELVNKDLWIPLGKAHSACRQDDATAEELAAFTKAYIEFHNLFDNIVHTKA